MGRFKHNTSVREFPWGKLTFNDARHITAETPTLTIVFHRYGAPRGSYGKWNRFCNELNRRHIGDIYDVYRYANQFEIEHFVKTTRVEKGGEK